MSPIKNILFDFGGVIYTQGTPQFMASLSQRYNLSTEFLRSIFEGKLGSEYREGKIARDDFWRQVMGALHSSETAAQLEREWDSDYRLIPETLQIVRELAKTHPLYYLSGNTPDRLAVLESEYHFMQYFINGVLTFHVGVRKPDPYIYTYTLHQFGFKPSETLLIDDKVEYLMPAQTLGMKTHLYVNPALLREYLTQNKLLP